MTAPSTPTTDAAPTPPAAPLVPPPSATAPTGPTEPTITGRLPWRVALRATFLQLQAVSAHRWSKGLVGLLALDTLTLAAARIRSGPDVVGYLGLASGILVITVIANASRWRRSLVIAGLVLATVPFAVLTWWSVVTPLIAVLTLAVGIPVLTRRDLR